MHENAHQVRRTTNRLPIYLLAVFATVLPSCTNSPESKSPKNQVVESTDTSSNNNKVVETKRGEKLVMGDYAHSNLMQAFPEDIDVSSEMTNQIKRDGRMVDLSGFRFTEGKVSRKNLEGLESAEAKEQVEDLRMNMLPVDDDALAAVSGLRNLVRLEVPKTNIKDLHVLAMLPVKITQLNVEHTNPNKQCWMNVSKQVHLKVLRISGTPVTNDDLMKLDRLTELKELDCYECPNLTVDGVHRLQGKIPKCKIGFGAIGFREANRDDLSTIDRNVFSTGDYEQADLAITRLLERWQAHGGEQDFRAIARAYLLKARCQDKLNHPEEARRNFEASMKVCRSHALPLIQVVQDYYSAFRSRNPDSSKDTQQAETNASAERMLSGKQTSGTRGDLK
jgi:hypothetical protein